MGFDSKHEFTPPTSLLGLLTGSPAPGHCCPGAERLPGVSLALVAGYLLMATPAPHRDADPWPPWPGVSPGRAAPSVPEGGKLGTAGCTRGLWGCPEVAGERLPVRLWLWVLVVVGVSPQGVAQRAPGGQSESWVPGDRPHAGGLSRNLALE